MAWLALHAEILREFQGLEVFELDGERMRFFRPESSASVVARVARWRKANRDRRNATARAAYARNPEAHRAAQRRYAAKERAAKRGLETGR